MLIAEKRQTGFQDVVNRIRRNGTQIREASLADWIVLHDPQGDTEDCKELRRPKGLPAMQHQMSSDATLDQGRSAGALPAGGLESMQLSAAKCMGNVQVIHPMSAMVAVSESPIHLGGSITCEASSIQSVLHTSLSTYTSALFCYSTQCNILLFLVSIVV
jgi:hypothetical protein